MWFKLIQSSGKQSEVNLKWRHVSRLHQSNGRAGSFAYFQFFFSLSLFGATDYVRCESIVFYFRTYLSKTFIIITIIIRRRKRKRKSRIFISEWELRWQKLQGRLFANSYLTVKCMYERKFATFHVGDVVWSFENVIVCVSLSFCVPDQVHCAYSDYTVCV